jgi:hypothetical protein
MMEYAYCPIIENATHYHVHTFDKHTIYVIITENKEGMQRYE